MKSESNQSGLSGSPSFSLAVSLGVFFALWIHGSTLGLSDDEAYYWVLAQTPSLGYAFHPPAVAWLIKLSEILFGWILPHPSAALVRLPAALSGSLILWLSLNWLRSLGLEGKQIKYSALTLLSFVGLFSLAWMMVPDSPLLLGWTLLFVLTWKACFEKPEPLHYTGMVLSTALILLSKYSGVLTLFSAAWALWIWAPRRSRWNGLASLVTGGILASIPIILWNSHHEWASILYQIRDRHSSGQISWIRYARFWFVEMLLAGPILVIYAVRIFFSSPSTLKTLLTKKKEITPENKTRLAGQYCLIWMFPAAIIFGIQPLFSDFKPHWAFVIWWVAVISLATQVTTPTAWKWIRYQIAYGLCMSVLVLSSFHIPIGTWLLQQFGKTDPKLDVTNDLYGWTSLGPWVQEEWQQHGEPIPIIGSRYQTAAQASFSLAGSLTNHLASAWVNDHASGKSWVTLFPKTLKERDEWPALDFSKNDSGHLKLTRPILYVADNRYDAPPTFPSATCTSLKRLETERGGYLVRWITLWRCEPTLNKGL